MPYAEPDARTGGSLASRPAALSGATVGIVNNSWRCMNVLAEELGARLRGEISVAALVERRISAAQTLPPETVDELASSCDAVVVGIGN